MTDTELTDLARTICSGETDKGNAYELAERCYDTHGLTHDEHARLRYIIRHNWVRFSQTKGD